MKLIELIITIDGEITRKIDFHDGLNLVTNTKGVGRTGNSVGKSTLSRVIDYIFLGAIGAIYIDEEFKKPNEEIENLFNTREVNVSLIFVGLDKRTHVVKRNFSIQSEGMLFELDGKSIDANQYEQSMQKLCFDIDTRRPSVRALSPKFIRNDSHRMLSTTKFLDKRSGKKDYSELFLYLFGFNNTQLLTDKRDATNLVSRRSRNSTSLNAMVKEQKPKVEIKKYIKEVKILEADLLKFDYSPEYSDPVLRLIELQKKEDSYTALLLSVERKVHNINNTIDLLESNEGGYLSNELQAVYQFAGVAIDTAIKELEAVVSFHENLIQKKRQFLTIELPDLLEEQIGLNAELSAIRKDKLRVFSDMRSTESIDNITTNLKKLGTLKVDLGKLEGLVEQQVKASEDLDLAEQEERKILMKIAEEIDNVHHFEKSFNKFFKKITSDIHNDKYELDLNFSDATGVCSIEVNNSVTNPEGGKKKAEVIAFDFAYIHAVSSTGLRRPKFIFHDSIEDIDQKQIEEILKQSKKLPGQQILSMLSDKLSPEIYEKYMPDTILLLDESNKFFGV